MKTRFSAILTLTSLLGGCSKPEMGPSLPADGGCSEIIQIPVSRHHLSAADVVTVERLFARNNIASRNYRFTRYQREAVQTYFPPYVTFDSQVVGVEEYANGLRTFTGHSNFLFKNGVFSYRAGKPTGGTGLDTQPARSPEQLQGLFFATIAAYDPRQLSLQDQCVSLEFGYYDVNAGTSNAAENLVKAWKVTVENRPYPYAYYQDPDGKLIYYDNGIRTFR